MTGDPAAATSGDRVAGLRADIEDSPAALERLLDGWRSPDLAGRRRFAFAGLGSSRFAAMVVAQRLAARGTRGVVEHASSAGGINPADDLVLFAVSASGRTPEVLATAARHRGRSRVVAVTNRPASPLGAAADAVIDLAAGEEVSGIACRTFRATTAALAAATGVAAPTAMRPAIDAIRALSADSGSWAPALADVLDGAPSIDVLADASMLGVAEQAALMLREAPRLPAHAVETSDWLHTHVYLALPGHRVLLYPGSPADVEVIDTVRRRGGEVAIVPSRPGDAAMDPLARAIAASIVAEAVAAELWRRASAT